MRLLLKVIVVFPLVCILSIVVSAPTAFAATPTAVTPLDAGGGCSPINASYYSDLTVSIQACINTDSDTVNANGVISLSAGNVSKWRSGTCKVHIAIYDDTDGNIAAYHTYDCFSSPRNFSNAGFGPLDLGKTGGHNYHGIVEVLGIYDGISVASSAESPGQCVGWFC